MPAAAVLLLTVLFFLPGLSYDFLLWDDSLFVVDNPRIGLTWENIRWYATEPFFNLYTPLPLYSLMLDRAVFGLDPVMFHWHNLLLHLAGACFFGLMLRRIGARDAVAWGAALLWAIQPQKIESVLWISERKDVLCGALVFASLYAMTRAMARNRPPWLAGVLAALAMWAKPAALPIGGVMIVWYWCRYRRRPDRMKRMRQLTGPLLLFAAAAAWSAWVTAKNNPGVPETDWAIPVGNLFRYPLTVLLPLGLNPVYPAFSGGWAAALPYIGGGVVMALLFVMAARKCRWEITPVVAFLLIVAGTTVPVLGLLRYTTYTFCDRYNYLVSAAVLAAAAMLAESALRQGMPRRIVAGCGIGMAFFFWFTGWCYMPYWKNDDSLFGYALSRPGAPNLKAVEFYLAAVRPENEEACYTVLAETVGRYREEYIRLEGERPVIHFEAFLAGHLAWLRQDFAGCQAHYRRIAAAGGRDCLFVDRAAPVFCHDLGMISLAEKRYGDALKMFRAELQWYQPDSVEYRETAALITGVEQVAAQR